MKKYYIEFIAKTKEFNHVEYCEAEELISDNSLIYIESPNQELKEPWNQYIFTYVDEKTCTVVENPEYLDVLKEKKIEEVVKYYDGEDEIEFSKEDGSMKVETNNFRDFTITKDDISFIEKNNTETRNWYFERYLIDGTNTFIRYYSDDEFMRFNSIDVKRISDFMAYEKDVMYKNKLLAEKEINALTTKEELNDYDYETVLNNDLKKKIML